MRKLGFVDVGAKNYRLIASSPAVDAGVAASSVLADRAGSIRPQGAGFDVGAFELAEATGAPEPSSSVLFALGLLSLGCCSRPRRRRA